MPSRRTLARRLERVEDFPEPSADLEQYLTPSEIAAHICHFAALQGDISGETVVDLGTGTGMLAIGARLCDPDRVIGIDLDGDALDLARRNARSVISETAVDPVSSDESAAGSHPSPRTNSPATISSTADTSRPASDDRAATDGHTSRRTSRSIDWIRGDVTRPPVSVDDTTVLSNPPFGAQRGNRHADRDFLETTRSIAATSYTIHNEGSQEFVESYASDVGAAVTHAFRATFSLENRLEFHTSETRTLDAEVFRIEWNSDSRP